MCHRIVIDLNKPLLVRRNGVARHRSPVERTCKTYGEIQVAGSSEAVIDAAHIEGKHGFCEEKIDVFQIGLHIFVDEGLAVVVEIVFNLHVGIAENLGIALVDDHILIPGRGQGVTQHIERILQEADQVLHLRLVFRYLFRAYLHIFLLR